ncbi:unnamed protein product [Caenorhabditis angaria]|uniref:Uncharacterized protein n=1 Tax=Caenorhabditis angaria TaxID=860376 RepID=A0A9P1IYG4_9PELO|nr:unnamed protein product [Caenorhabditis angaria]
MERGTGKLRECAEEQKNRYQAAYDIWRKKDFRQNQPDLRQFRRKSTGFHRYVQQKLQEQTLPGSGLTATTSGISPLFRSKFAFLIIT